MPETTVTNVIGAQSSEGEGDLFPIVDPTNGSTIAEYRAAGAETVDRAFVAAEAAFSTWRRTAPGERQRMLLELAEAIEFNAEQICDAEVRETGKPRDLTLNLEILRAADQLRFFAGLGRAPQGLAQTEYLPGFTSSVRREPVGVVAQVTPWNYPFMMAMWKIAPALAAGNTVVLKPAETTPTTTVMLARLAAEILPAGVFNVVVGGRETGRLLSAHPAANMVSITGSVRAGTEVMIAASERIARVHLELGGKAPAIVFPDADIDGAIEGIASAAYFNAGQDCTAITRLIVHEDIHDEFLARFIDHIAALRPASAGDDQGFYGPLNSRAQFERVQSILARLPEHVTVAAGGELSETGFYLTPTVLTGVRQDDEVVQTEIFAPLVTVQAFATEEEAVALANGVTMALTSSLWTRNHGRATALSTELEFGTVWINCHQILPAEMPHGGYKTSGLGKDLSIYGYEDYTRVKHVMSSHAR